MTFDEIQKIIEGMLAVQKDLQESQIKLLESQVNHEQVLTRLEESLTRSEENYERQQKLIDKLLSYTISNNADIDEQLRILDARIQKVENRND